MADISDMPDASALKKLSKISDMILDESSSQEDLHAALNDFSDLCSKITNIIPDRTFDAWSEDSYLDGGVAINPQAAAYCIKDYQRSIVFIRAVHAAFNRLRTQFSNTTINILYAGCGPFATLILPLLSHLLANNTRICLLDIHSKSLESVNTLLCHFGFNHPNIQFTQGDACTYQHPKPLHLIIAETMQKSLEQEPQFAVTANLAPQLHSNGIFIPENIQVQICLAQKKSIERTHSSKETRQLLGSLLNLDAKSAHAQAANARLNNSTGHYELAPVIIEIPRIKNPENLDALLLTKIRVFEHFVLGHEESEITLPSKCEELSPIKPGAQYTVSYQLGKYPRFTISET
jgi:hypothetical protein